MTSADASSAAGGKFADVLIVGAGMAGLTAAVDLQRRGHRVLVVDKGRGPGGRLATRRYGEATFDHGAQFVTAKDPRFAGAMAEWATSGVIAEWYRGADGRTGGHPRYRGRPTMNAVAKHLARDVEVLLSRRVVTLRQDADGWLAELEDGPSLRAGVVLLTAPVPQALALLESGAVAIAAESRTSLESITYERCLAVMAVLNEPSGIPAPGFVAPDAGPIAWLADNQAKGVSTVPAITIHASADYSLEHWDRDRQTSGQELLAAAGRWLAAAAVDFQVHGWRYSKPVAVEKNACLILNRSPALVIAGDAFAGPRVEGAALSGWAAAAALDALVRQR